MTRGCRRIDALDTGYLIGCWSGDSATVCGDRAQASRRPRASSLIEKETMNNRIANDEVRNFIYFIYYLIEQSEATSTIRQSSIVIRYAAVRCSMFNRLTVSARRGSLWGPSNRQIPRSTRLFFRRFHFQHGPDRFGKLIDGQWFH
jgi:hypothetical protein